MDGLLQMNHADCVIKGFYIEIFNFNNMLAITVADLACHLPQENGDLAGPTLDSQIGENSTSAVRIWIFQPLTVPVGGATAMVHLQKCPVTEDNGSSLIDKSSNFCSCCELVLFPSLCLKPIST